MKYVQAFNINGVCAMQLPCLKVNGKPNAATEGCIGLLAMDVTSPTHEVYKCVAVNGAIYTWELLTSGCVTKEELDRAIEDAITNTLNTEV